LIEIAVIATPALGDRTYLVHDGEVGVVIDAQRDIDRVLDVATGAGVRLTHVLETHVHNDYVSGGLALCRRTGASYVLAAGEDVAFERHGVVAGDEIRTGSMSVLVHHTPGHTDAHLSFELRDANGPTAAVFTGGSLLYGTVGRTDLLGVERSDELTRAQYRSVRRLIEDLPAGAAVYPTHGFGSFCSSVGGSARDSSTIGDERRDNVVMAVDDEDEFVRRLLAGLTDHPAYYSHMALLNRAGPLEADFSPPVPVQGGELRRRLESGEWVVDLRRRRAFAADHLAGSVGIELSDPFATYLGWLIPWGSRLTLIGETPEEITAAQRQLVRIGIDRPQGAVSGPTGAMAAGHPRRSYRVAEFADLAAACHSPGLTVLDVRRRDEWNEGHVSGARNVPLHELVDHVHHVPSGELWVHCTTGMRASIAASLLDRAGHRVVLVDADFQDAGASGLTIETGATVDD